MTAKRNLLLGLLIGLVLGAAFPAFLSVHSWTSAQDSRQVLLRQGWNQLVWTADNQTADTALAAIADDLVMAYGWQGDSQTFSRYIPGRADVSTMGEVKKDSGYWLLMTRDAAFSVPTADIQCPACPDPTALLSAYLLSESCTATKLIIELAEFTDVDAASSKEFFSKNCQGVGLLKGSRLSGACTTAATYAALVVCPTGPPDWPLKAQQAAVLMERYCTP